MTAQALANVTAFGHDVWWIILLKVVVIFAVLLLTTLFTIWLERRVVARMQQRLGPNRVGPFGLLQSLADGIKLMLKEDIVVSTADRAVYLLAPVASAVPAFLAFSVIPFGPAVSVAGHHTNLQLTDLSVGVLFILAMSSLGVYGVVLAGWASGSTYPLLGALRSAAQMISYEVAMGLALVPVFLVAGSLSTFDVVDSQRTGLWYVITLLPSFVIYGIAAVGETNRAPFDLPEAESELVGGYHTEYSSIKFAFFFLAEYINMVTVSALATTLFLGGWRAPWPISRLHVLSTGWFPVVWFAAKVFLCLFVFIWLRGTLPRLRYDQFMQFGWKWLVPAALVWVVLLSGIRTVGLHVTNTRTFFLGAAAVVFVLFVLLLVVPGVWNRNKPLPKEEAIEPVDTTTIEHVPFPPPDREGTGVR